MIKASYLPNAIGSKVLWEIVIDVVDDFITGTVTAIKQHLGLIYSIKAAWKKGEEQVS